MRRAVASILLALLLSACRASGFAAPSPVTAPVPTAAAPPAEASHPAGTAAAPTPMEAAKGLRNPVLDRDFPDPDSILVGNGYYAYATNSGGMNILVASSPDLVRWNFLGNALPRPPRWAFKGFGNNWAPEVSQFGNSYVMYFASRLPVGSGGIQCIALATSERPQGPFLPTEQSNLAPFVCQENEGGSIDPAVFRDDDGRSYLLWKSDANSRGGQTWIYIQPLSEDGLSLQGQPARLITADARWEGLLVEAPTLWKHGGRYYLFYSANDYANRDYAVGYAVAERPTGPYIKGKTNPILKTNIGAAIVGPGGQDVTMGPDGKTYMLFHSWRPGGYRALDVAPLDWVGGVPVVTLPARTAAQ
ncbi:MAG: glycoside hydrolase family 43 protein [Nitrososphaerales archaeon]